MKIQINTCNKAKLKLGSSIALKYFMSIFGRVRHELGNEKNSIAKIADVNWLITVGTKLLILKYFALTSIRRRHSCNIYKLTQLLINKR